VRPDALADVSQTGSPAMQVSTSRDLHGVHYEKMAEFMKQSSSGSAGPKNSFL
jgi:hypothetical protein